MKYTDQGNNIPISAAIFSSNLNALSVEWYHEDTLINTTNNPHFSINTDIVSRVSVLNIMNVDTDILGEYTIIVYSEGRNERDSIELVTGSPTSSPTNSTSSSSTILSTSSTVAMTNPSNTPVVAIVIGSFVGVTTTIAAVIACVVVIILIMRKFFEKKMATRTHDGSLPPIDTPPVNTIDKPPVDTKIDSESSDSYRSCT